MRRRLRRVDVRTGEPLRDRWRWRGRPTPTVSNWTRSAPRRWRRIRRLRPVDVGRRGGGAVPRVAGWELPRTSRLAFNVDNLLVEDQVIRALQRVREAMGLDLKDATSIVLGRKAEIVPPKPLLTVDELVQSARLALKDASIKAHWDGDTEGWFVVLAALTADGLPLWRSSLRAPGGDMRLFNGAVPPWPEAALACAAGARLSTLWNVPFTFDQKDGPRE